jgi:hypothetical protein
MIFWGDAAGERDPGNPVRTEPHPPMVCVKLPKSVLGLFHLLEQRSCHFLGLKFRQIITLSRVSSWRLIVPFAFGQGSLLSAHVDF